MTGKRGKMGPRGHVTSEDEVRVPSPGEKKSQTAELREKEKGQSSPQQKQDYSPVLLLQRSPPITKPSRPEANRAGRDRRRRGTHRPSADRARAALANERRQPAGNSTPKTTVVAADTRAEPLKLTGITSLVLPTELTGITSLVLPTELTGIASLVLPQTPTHSTEHTAQSTQHRRAKRWADTARTAQQHAITGQQQHAITGNSNTPSRATAWNHSLQTLLEGL
ncbi:hypothetical protein ACOMHN_023981 [Nucella lapillus]